MKSEKLILYQKTNNSRGKNSEKYKSKQFDIEKINFKFFHGITLISLIITIVILIILTGIVITLSLGNNGIFNRVKEGTEKYKIEQMREQVEIGILDSETQRININEKLTIEGALQDLVENKIFESIDKQEQLGYIGEYEVKLKYNEENKVIIEYIQKATGVRAIYTLDPVGYTNTAKVNILFKVRGKVKSVITPKGLKAYPRNEVIETEYEVTANGIYKFVIEKENGSTIEKEVTVDTIDTIPPKDFAITAKNTGTGFIITANVEDAEATETSVKSGINKIEYYVKLSTATQYTKYETNNIENLQQGEYNIYAIAYDRANNKTQTKVITAKVMDPLVEMYGKNVSYSVKVNGTTLDNWKVFYIDKKTKDTFLIYGAYLPTNTVPTSLAKMKVKNTYNAIWDRYSPPAMQSNWVTNRKLFMANKFTLNSSHKSSRCVSTALNTNNWVSFVDTNYADLAIGTPTLEMFCESWNAKGYTKLNLSTNSNGYIVNGRAGEYVAVNASKEKSDKLYFPYASEIGGSRGYWLAAPYDKGAKEYPNIWTVYYIGGNSTAQLDTFNSQYTMSLRPVIHLKNGENGVELKWNTGTNKYDIINKQS